MNPTLFSLLPPDAAMLSKQLVVVACLTFYPLPATAAAEGALPVPFLGLLFFVVIGLLAAVLWLGLRIRIVLQENKALATRLYLEEQVGEHNPLPILRLDADLKVLTANRRALRTYDRPSLVGVSLLDLHPELTEHPVVTVMQSARETTSALPPLAPAPGTQENSANGHLVILPTSGQPQALWFGTGSDAKHLVQAASEAVSQAEESVSRMKSEFIANINHEVRTPMNAIIGYTEMLANSQLGPKEKRFVAIIHKSSMALVSIFNDIMELSKIDSGRLQIMLSTVRLSLLVSEVEGLFKDLADEKGVLLSSRIAGHLPPSLLLDGVRLKQVLQNLVSNAVKFTHTGSVTLLVDGSLSPGKEGGVDLRITVEDTGIGISVPDQQKIFQLFRLQEGGITKQYGGVGLGLTLCSRLAAMMGGRIELESKEGEGTRFTLLLDGVQVAEPAPAGPETAAAPMVEKGTRKLLVVDDVDLIKDVFIDYFHGSPFKVLTANNSEEALALARSEQPDLIFMDLNLTGANGRTVTEELRRNRETAAIPVVVMTGEMLDEDDYRPLFDDFLQKPFRLEALQTIIACHVQSSRGRAEHPAEHDGDEEEQLFALRFSGVWSKELEALRQQAVFSGSLADAAALGAAVRQQGMAENQPVLTGLGEDLLLHAHEPNILGVDRLLAKLSRIAIRNEP
jgi:signal transduction histidine kinase/CheY-like chemotaxis protein